MSSFLYPDSHTRKLFGKRGLEQQMRNQKSNYLAILKLNELAKKQEVEALKKTVMDYENAKWYKKLWLLILELFGRKKPIL